MPSNSQYVNRKRFGMPVATAVVATILWPTSYVAAVNTAIPGAFVDVFTGALAVAAFLGAAGATLATVIFSMESVDHWIDSAR